jgi:hypothetical protein
MTETPSDRTKSLFKGTKGTPSELTHTWRASPWNQYLRRVTSLHARTGNRHDYCDYRGMSFSFGSNTMCRAVGISARAALPLRRRGWGGGVGGVRGGVL